MFIVLVSSNPLSLPERIRFAKQDVNSGFAGGIYGFSLVYEGQGSVAGAMNLRLSLKGAKFADACPNVHWKTAS